MKANLRKKCYDARMCWLDCTDDECDYNEGGSGSYIERQRSAYYKEWFKYLGEDTDAYRDIYCVDIDRFFNKGVICTG